MVRTSIAATIVVLLALVFALDAPQAQAGPSVAYDQQAPTVTYNPDLRHFMAMWVEDRGEGQNIYFKRLFSNGLPQGGPNRRGTAVIRDRSGSTVGARYDPALVYNTHQDEYYLVWSEERTAKDGLDVYGVRVSTAGYSRTTPRKLAGGPGDQTHPSIAYNTSRRLYLAAWQDNTRDVDEIWGVRIRANGIAYGKPLSLVSRSSNAQDPSVARNGTGFMVAWVDDETGNANILSRRLNSNALPVGGTSGQITTMAGTPSDELSPALNPDSGSLVYNVYDPLTGLDIVGVRVYDSGGTRGQRPIGISVPAADQSHPVTANGSEQIVLYSDNRSGEFDLYAIRVRNNRPRGRDYPVMQDGYVP